MFCVRCVLRLKKQVFRIYTGDEPCEVKALVEEKLCIEYIVHYTTTS